MKYTIDEIIEKVERIMCADYHTDACMCDHWPAACVNNIPEDNFAGSDVRAVLEIAFPLLMEGKMTETMIPVSKWEHCGDTNPHVTHTYDVSEQGVPTHCLGSPWTERDEDQN